MKRSQISSANVGFGVAHGAGIVAEDLEARAVELAEPALDRNFPVGMQVKEAADDADAQRLVRRRRRRHGHGGELLRDDARDHAAIDALQFAVVLGLVGEQKRLPWRDRRAQVADELARRDIVAERAQLALVGGAPAGNLLGGLVDDRQFGHAVGKARFRIVRPERQRALEILKRLVVAVELDQDGAAPIIGFGIVGILRQLTIESSARLVEAIERDQEAAEIVGGLAEARVDLQRAPVARQRRIELTELFLRGAAVVVRLDIFRVERQRAVEAHHRLVVAAERAQQAAAIIVRLGVVGLDGDRLAVAVERFVVPVERGQHRAAVVVRLGVFRFQLERVVEAFQRLLVAVEGVENEAVVEQHLGRRRAHAHGRGNEVQRLGRLALGELHQAHHLQGVEVIGTRGEHLRVERFGLKDLPALMEMQRLGESLRDVERTRLRQRLRHDESVLPHREVKKPG